MKFDVCGNMELETEDVPLIAQESDSFNAYMQAISRNDPVILTCLKIAQQNDYDEITRLRFTLIHLMESKRAFETEVFRLKREAKT
jgi:hypothetical protein